MLGMKVVDLSREAKVGHKTLANAESRNQRISLEFAIRLAMVLPDTKPEDLFLPADDAEDAPIKDAA